jgi:hypothetical protein
MKAHNPGMHQQMHPQHKPGAAAATEVKVRKPSKHEGH